MAFLNSIEGLLAQAMQFYCETPAFVSGFPAEPVNTWTNLAIVMAGILGMYVAHTCSQRSSGPMAVAISLFVTGWMSFWWHGTRDVFAFAADAGAGQITFLVMLGFWLRLIFPRWGVIGAFIVIIALTGVQGMAMAGVRHQSGELTWLLVAVLFVASVALAARTWQVSPRAGKFATAMIAAATIAIVSRTTDAAGGAVCQMIPVGIHWAWHLGMSVAALMSIFMLIELESARRS